MLGYHPPRSRHPPHGRHPLEADIHPRSRSLPPWKQTPQKQTPPLHSSECWEIWSTSGQYASYWNAIFFLNTFKTRMHSSRMHTARLMTISHSIPCNSGGSTSRGVCFKWGLHPGEGICIQGICLQKEGLPPGAGGGWADPPDAETPWSCDLGCMLESKPPSPVDRQTPVKLLPYPNFVCGR